MARLPGLTVEKHRASSLGEEKEKVLYPADLPPEWSLKIFSEHTLQLTITKTSLELLTGLSKVTDKIIDFLSLYVLCSPTSLQYLMKLIVLMLWMSLNQQLIV